MRDGHFLFHRDPSPGLLSSNLHHVRGHYPSGRGKRGGARVIYYWHPKSQQVLMLFVFAKNERDDLTAAQRRALRRIVETEYA